MYLSRSDLDAQITDSNKPMKIMVWSSQSLVLLNWFLHAL